MTGLNAFATYEACQPERNRVGFEMAEAYPGENDFLIVCEFREQTPGVPVRDVVRREMAAPLTQHEITTKSTLRRVATVASW